MTAASLTSPNNPYVIFNFKRSNEDCAWQLRSIQGNNDAHVWSVQPKGAQAGMEFLNDTLFAFFSKVLNSFHIPGVIAMKDTVVTLPGLVLAKLRLIGRQREDGEQTVIARFSEIIGNTRAVLGSTTHPHNLKDEREDLATRVLTDLVRPCLDLAELEDDSIVRNNSDAVLARLRQLRETREELAFMAELLRRCVDTPDAPHDAAIRSKMIRY